MQYILEIASVGSSFDTQHENQLDKWMVYK